MVQPRLRPRRRPALALALASLVFLASCSADPGPAETSAADAPVRAPTTTAPPPPSLERVALERSVLAGPGDQRMVAVAVGVTPALERRLVAVGRDGGRPAVWWSSDGRTWLASELAPEPFGDTASFADVTGDPISGGWVAVGAEGDGAAAWSSLDGLTWERAEVDPGPAMTTVSATRFGLLAFGTGGTGDPGRDGGEETAAWQSFSGRRWVRAVDDPDLFARPGPERVVAVVDTGTDIQAVVERESQGPEVWRSTDALFWSPAPPVGADLLPAEGRPGAAAAVALGSTLAVVGTDAKADGADASLWLSTGPQTYRQAPHDEAALGGDGTQAMLALTRSGDQLVVVGTETDDRADVDAVVWSSSVGSPLRRAEDDGLAVPGDQHVVDVALLGATSVAVGWETSPEGDDAVVWVVESAPVEAPDAADDAPTGPALGWQRVAASGDWSGPGEQRMDALVAVGDGFVAVGSVAGADGVDGAVWRSIDGQEWRPAGGVGVLGGPGAQRLLDVAAGPAGLVAVGADGESAAVWTSPDGEIWQRVAHDEGVFGGSGDQRMEAVVAQADGAGWVAVGSDDGGGTSDAAIWRSADGLAWSRAPEDVGLGGEGDQGLADVVVGATGLVATGFDGESAVAWTSPDGSGWARTEFGPGRASGLAVGPGGALTVAGSTTGEGLDSAIWQSADGVGWSRSTGDLVEPLDQGLTAVAVGGDDLAVAVGRTDRGGGDDAAAWASSDGGATWARSPHAEHIFGGDQAQRMEDVVVWEGLVVAVGHTGSTPETRDAAVWVTDLAGGGGRANL